MSASYNCLLVERETNDIASLENGQRDARCIDCKQLHTSKNLAVRAGRCFICDYDMQTGRVRKIGFAHSANYFGSDAEWKDFLEHPQNLKTAEPGYQVSRKEPEMSAIVADCKYGVDCHMQKCWFKHPEGRVAKAPVELTPCKFGVKCHRADCAFSHPAERSISPAGAQDEQVPPS